MSVVWIIFIVGIISAAFLMYKEKEGWGWIVFILLCLCSNLDKDLKQDLKVEIFKENQDHVKEKHNVEVEKEEKIEDWYRKNN